MRNGFMPIDKIGKEALKKVCIALNTVFFIAVEENNPERSFIAMEWISKLQQHGIAPICWTGEGFKVNVVESLYEPSKIKNELFINVMKYGMYYRGRDVICNICGKEFGHMQDMMNHLMCEHLEDYLPEIEPLDRMG